MMRFCCYLDNLYLYLVLYLFSTDWKIHSKNHTTSLKKLQNSIRNHLINTIKKYSADSGLAVVLDIKSGEILSMNTFYAVCDFLALGIDPEKSTFWVQSDVPQVVELNWILSF